MGIIDIFKPKFQGYSFEQSPHFRGFKAFPFSVYGEKDAEENNERLKDIDLAGAVIRFAPSAKYYNIFLNDHRIGSIYDANLIKSIPDIKAVHLEPVTEAVAGKKVTERHRFKLFVRR